MENILKGKKMIIAVIVVLLLIDIATTIVATSVYANAGMLTDAWVKLIQGIIRFLITGLILFFLYKGHKWAKWLMIVLLILGGLLGGVSFLATRSSVLLAMAILYLGIGIMLISSASINDFFRYRRGEINETANSPKEEIIIGE